MTGIFKGNDIRGIYNKDLNKDISKKIGYVFDKSYKKSVLLLGYDNRLSSKSLKQAFIYGIKSKIIDLGMVPTPLFYYALDHIPNSKGVMITASHLPKEFNGFKLQISSFPLTYSSGIKDIENKVKHINKVKKTNKIIIKRNLNKSYINYLVSKVKIKRKLNIALDAGNGVGALILLPVLKKLKIKVTPIYCNPDGNYPNHVADPIIDKNLKDLQNLVVKNKLDFGIALDGDADRMKIVSPKGKIIESEILASLLLKHLNPKNKKVIYSAICSDVIRDVAKTLGAKPVIEKIGHSFIKNTALKQRAIMTVEYTGHMGFKENNSILVNDGLQFNIETLTFSEKERAIKAVIEMNEGFLCKETINSILNFKQGDEEREGYNLANAFVEAGLKVPEDVFVEYYKRFFGLK